MPTIDARVAASTDDANELSSGNVQTNTTSFNVDQTGEWLAFRVAVTIPDGATIDVAYLTLQFDSGTLDEPDLTIYGEDSVTPAAYSAGTATFSISGRARTTASVDWASTDLGAPGAFNSPSIVAIVQELMASYSYAAGAYMALMWTSRANDATRDAQVVCYDGNAAQAPLLHIEYTEAGSGIEGSATITMADATLVAAGTLPIAGVASPALGNVTLAAAGTLALTGATTATLANATLVATGVLPLAGALAATLDDMTVVATGDLDDGNSGIATVTLADTTLAASGALSIAGQAAIALSGVTLSSIGTVVILGAATMTLANVTLVASGAEPSDTPTVAAIVYGPNIYGEVFGPASSGGVFGPHPVATLGG